MHVLGYCVGGGIPAALRFIGLQRWLRIYCEAVGERFECVVMASTEVDAAFLTAGIPTLKIPTPDHAAASAIDRSHYFALAKQWSWSALASYRPSVVIVDGRPRGAFGELYGALDGVKTRVLVAPVNRPEWIAAADFTAIAARYSCTLLPESPRLAHAPMHEALGTRLNVCGSIFSRDRASMMPRDRARQALGVQGDRPVVLMAGDDDLVNVCEQLLRETEVHIVAAPGPLYAGAVIGGPRVSWFAHDTAMDYAAAFDGIERASGYTTLDEAVHLTTTEYENGAPNAAAAIIGAHLGDQVRVKAVAAINDSVLRAASTADIATVELVRWLRYANSETAITDAALVLFVRALIGHPPEALDRVLRAFCDRVRTGDRLIACSRLVAELAPFADWSGAIAFVESLVSENEATPIDLSVEIASFLTRLRGASLDLFGAVKHLRRAQGFGDRPRSNLEALRASFA